MKSASKWLGPILLIGVFLRHDTSQWLPGYSPGAWFYIAGGVWEILLCSSLLLTLPVRPLSTAAMLIGILEGAQTSTCRLLTADITKVPKGANLCDYLTGWPIGFLTTFAELGLIVGVIAMSFYSVRRS